MDRTPYIYYNVTLYKSFRPFTGTGLPVIDKELIGEGFVRVRPGESDRWNVSELKRAQWQATK